MTEEVKILRIAGNRKRYDVLYHLFRQPAADTFSSERKRNFYPVTPSRFLPSATTENPSGLHTEGLVYESFVDVKINCIFAALKEMIA
jgi:hypothetical protein